MADCPYCGGRLVGASALPPMSKRMERIYKAVVAAGPDGVKPESLMEIMRDDGPQRKSHFGVLRVMVYEINKIIASHGQKIQSRRRGAYRLVKT